jgi:DGQHR domain-containing protein
VYIDYPAARYFGAVTDAIRKSSRFEFLNFLKINSSDIAKNGKIDVSEPSKSYTGSLLPEGHSHFDKGYKIVTFYADPDALLKTSYVLRRDGWNDSINLYQRMISKGKIESIRAYLKKQKRVFINNIIVTLPPEVKPLNDAGDTVSASNLTQTAPVTITLPDQPNSIGIVDGQHRVFAYHETANDDEQIAQLRLQQNLLVTGIIFPKHLSIPDRQKFEARLFLEINSTQTNAKSQLKQAIGIVLEPFATDSIAARVLGQLARKGPLSGLVEQYFFDTDKLKTSSIVSYGLRPLVKTSGTDSLFAIWNNQNKLDVANGSNDDALSDYVDFCVDKINILLSSVKSNLEPHRWTNNKKTACRILTTTYINSFLITLRLLLERNYVVSFEELQKSFIGINDFNFTAYHSSQYNRMAEKILETHFPNI